MPDERTYSESEHVAILADRVQRETADLTTERDLLASEKAELESRLDVEVAAKTAAEQRALEAEKALSEFKQEIEDREAASARKEQRLSKIREAASHMDEEFFNDEARVSRIVAMDEEAFDGYVADLGAAAKNAPAKNDPLVPRQTAMAGDQGGAVKAAAAGRGFLMRDYFAANKEG